MRRTFRGRLARTRRPAGLRGRLRTARPSRRRRGPPRPGRPPRTPISAPATRPAPLQAVTGRPRPVRRHVRAPRPSPTSPTTRGRVPARRPADQHSSPARQSFIAHGPGPVRRQLLQLPRPDGRAARRGRRTCRAWGRGPSTSGCPPGRMPLATPASRPPASPRASTGPTLEIAALVQSLTPDQRRGHPSRWSTSTEPTSSSGQRAVHPQLRRLPHHHRRR